MTQLDPFIIYTVKLAMDFKSVDNLPKDVKEKNISPEIFPETMSRIMAMKSIPLRPGEKAPKLRRDNLLSLLYHADEQWVNSSINLKKSIDKKEEIEYAINCVHHQQRIYLDTLHLLIKSVLPSNQYHKRLNESIWFSIQVLNNKCQIRHLEKFTNIIYPLACKVYDSIENIRLLTHQLLQKQEILNNIYKKQKESFFSNLFSSKSNNNDDDGDINFYFTRENQELLNRLEPHFISFIYNWNLFENELYKCYINTVFGNELNNLVMNVEEEEKEEEEEEEKEEDNSIIKKELLSNQELFNDKFTQLLPITLERAINLNIIDIQLIQSLDPISFIALPRLSILAGLTWLSHLTGWRNNLSNLPIWIKSHKETLKRITIALNNLEIQLLKNQSQHKNHSFVQIYKRLEKALVSGKSLTDDFQPLENQIFLDICLIADSVLSSHRTQSFTVVLCHLFKHFGQQYDIVFEESEDAVPLEQTILDLAI